MPHPEPSPGLPARTSRPAVRSRRRRSSQIRAFLRWYRVLSRAVQRTVLNVAAHDCLNVAQSTAYSAIVALFPALIFAAAVIGLIPDTAPIRFQLAAFFARVLPPGVGPLLEAAVENTPNHIHSLRALISAAIVSFLGASNVIATLMEGMRRARELPDNWSFWERRRRSFELVPLALAPLAVVSLLVVFGHAVSGWLSAGAGPEVRNSIYVITMLIRWTVALGTSVSVIALLYHLGVPDGPLGLPRGAFGGHRPSWIRLPVTRGHVPPAPAPVAAMRSWQASLPGAIMATAMWFLTTLAFGWYVTRFANYSEVYGSLGAGIALLFWLYIISLSVLCGAEFNVQFEMLYHVYFSRRLSGTLPKVIRPAATDSNES
jgi:membrane protein